MNAPTPPTINDAGNNVKLTSKHFLIIAAIGLVVLIGWLVYSRHEQARQAEAAYFNAQETFQLPAANGGYTSYKDIEKDFRNCVPNCQRVSVTSIELACNTKEITHQVDDRISNTEVVQAIAHGEQVNRKDMEVINRYNSVARHGTVSDGFDISWGVNVTITHRLKRSPANAEPLSVEWLCPDPSAANRLPIRPSGDLPTLALTKYGIQITQTKDSYHCNLGGVSSWGAEGLFGTNTFSIEIAKESVYHAPATSPSLLFDSPITYLKWNGDEIYIIKFGKVVNLDNPVLKLPEIKTLATWAQDCISQIKSSD